jgi:hypothetical protein
MKILEHPMLGRTTFMFSLSVVAQDIAMARMMERYAGDMMPTASSDDE